MSKAEPWSLGNSRTTEDTEKKVHVIIGGGTKSFEKKEEGITGSSCISWR